MVSSKTKKHISSLHVNGMDGRMLKIEGTKAKKRQIFALYGHHSSLERMFGLAEVLSDYGTVMMPDLPGFGGMDSFYKIGKEPDIENYADYLASLIKLYYKRRRITIFAMSFSVPLVIRMMQKYPDLAKKVDLFISIAGFAHRDDFIFPKTYYWGLRGLANVFSKRPPAWFAQKVILTRPVIKFTYLAVAKWHAKIKNTPDKEELQKIIDFEVGLWKMNDVRTRMSTLTLMLTVDVCKGKPLNVPVCHVTTSEDQYFNHQTVEQHLHIIFNQVTTISSEMPNHAPTIVASAKEAAPYVPKKLRNILK